MTIADMPARQMSMGLALSWQAARDPQRYQWGQHWDAQAHLGK